VAEPIKCVEERLLPGVGRGMVVPQNAPCYRPDRALVPRDQARKRLRVTAEHSRNDLGIRVHEPSLHCFVAIEERRHDGEMRPEFRNSLQKWPN
jgi:hypothetical protein